jgi:hypothetical protein
MAEKDLSAARPAKRRYFEVAALGEGEMNLGLSTSGFAGTAYCRRLERISTTKLEGVDHEHSGGGVQ